MAIIKKYAFKLEGTPLAVYYKEGFTTEIAPKEVLSKIEKLSSLVTKLNPPQLKNCR